MKSSLKKITIMKKSVKDFYKKMYEMERVVLQPKGLLGWFFTRLRKFERHRTSKTFDLLLSGKKFLDVGCGDGSLVTRAKEKFDYLES